ncbi:IRK-interacting protein [Humulus lupulus]|uniref:IRK-interacting protein n=1 Tax=Humulus lupulus TaxID=3486 RepID=UPI002B4020AC|nr:IRK-interacting protein [Humulus lupulus]
MAPSSSSSPSPSSSSKSPPSPHDLPSSGPNQSSSTTATTAHFTPIQECEREEEHEEDDETPGSNHHHTACTEKGTTPKHIPTPLHHHQQQQQPKNGKTSSKKRQESGAGAGDDATVACYKCRPHAREKISVVPVDNNGVHRHSSSVASPNSIFKSIISSLTRRSPKPSDALPSSAAAAREEQWKIAVAELSHKLIQATRKRDDAVLEASRLKYSMAELEKKLNKLEIYCRNLKSGLDECSISNNSSPCQVGKIQNRLSFNLSTTRNDDKEVVDNFLVTVSEARTNIRVLSRSLTMQLRHMGGKVYDRITALLQPYDIKISLSKNPRTLLIYLEALLNKSFFEDFESSMFQKNSAAQVLNPIDRCETNYASFKHLKGLTWEEVLTKGTKHFSEEFSRFCDRKMSEIVAMLGWNRAWPEPLLQAFFGASKSVWLVHLLANSVHPNLGIFRVDKETGFDSVYMEDMGGGGGGVDRARKLVPSVVRIMVAPGFYVYGSVVKCKVLCRYQNDKSISGNSKSLISSSPP